MAKVKLKSELVCRGCGAAWAHTTGKINTNCPYCGQPKDARDRKGEAAAYGKAPVRKASMIAWYADADNRKARAAQQRVLLRKRVFFRICGSIDPACVRCGCDDPRLLEINHKNGGGSKETQKGKSNHQVYYNIARGIRPVDDLELLCKPCNAIHCLEMKYGQLPMKVVWSPRESPST